MRQVREVTISEKVFDKLIESYEASLGKGEGRNRYKLTKMQVNMLCNTILPPGMARLQFKTNLVLENLGLLDYNVLITEKRIIDDSVFTCVAYYPVSNTVQVENPAGVEIVMSHWMWEDYPIFEEPEDLDETPAPCEDVEPSVKRKPKSLVRDEPTDEYGNTAEVYRAMREELAPVEEHAWNGVCDE